jgi:hypothetical protein
VWARRPKSTRRFFAALPETGAPQSVPEGRLTGCGEDVEGLVLVGIAGSLATNLAARRWCWVPDESSDTALAADLDMLIEHLLAGDPPCLMEPASGDMVHIQPVV